MDKFTKIYTIDSNKKFFIWGAEGSWEVTLEPHNGGFRCARDGTNVYVYPAPSPGSIIIVDNGDGEQREFMFVDGMLTPLH